MVIDRLVVNGARGASLPSVVVLVGLCVAGCGRDSSPTGPSASAGASLSLQAQVSDPAGDALPNQLNAPDLVRAAADVRSGSVTFEIALASGTFDSQATRLYIALDTDQDPSTGNSAWGIGAEFDVWMYARDRLAEIRRRLPNNAPAVGVGMIPVGMGADGMRVTMPLSLLGGDEGRLDFQIHSSGDPRVAGQSAAILDFMPNLGLPAGRLQ
jgi:hypothetical protein